MKVYNFRIVHHYYGYETGVFIRGVNNYENAAGECYDAYEFYAHHAGYTPGHFSKMFHLVRAPKDAIIRGFNVKKGSWILFAGHRAVAFCSGWHNDGSAFVYRQKDGKFVGDWTDPYGKSALDIAGEYLSSAEEYENARWREEIE